MRDSRCTKSTRFSPDCLVFFILCVHDSRWASSRRRLLFIAGVQLTSCSLLLQFVQAGGCRNYLMVAASIGSSFVWYTLVYAEQTKFISPANVHDVFASQDPENWHMCSMKPSIVYLSKLRCHFRFQGRRRERDFSPWPDAPLAASSNLLCILPTHIPSLSPKKDTSRLG